MEIALPQHRDEYDENIWEYPELNRSMIESLGRLPAGVEIWVDSNAISRAAKDEWLYHSHRPKDIPQEDLELMELEADSILKIEGQGRLRTIDLVVEEFEGFVKQLKNLLAWQNSEAILTKYRLHKEESRHDASNRIILDKLSSIVFAFERLLKRMPYSVPKLESGNFRQIYGAISVVSADLGLEHKLPDYLQKKAYSPVDEMLIAAALCSAIDGNPCILVSCDKDHRQLLSGFFEKAKYSDVHSSYQGMQAILSGRFKLFVPSVQGFVPYRWNEHSAPKAIAAGSAS